MTCLDALAGPYDEIEIPPEAKSLDYEVSLKKRKEWYT